MTAVPAPSMCADPQQPAVHPHPQLSHAGQVLESGFGDSSYTDDALHGPEAVSAPYDRPGDDSRVSAGLPGGYDAGPPFGDVNMLDAASGGGAQQHMPYGVAAPRVRQVPADTFRYCGNLIR